LKYGFRIVENEGLCAACPPFRISDPKDTLTNLNRSNILPLQFWTEITSLLQMTDIYIGTNWGENLDKYYTAIYVVAEKSGTVFLRHYTCLQLKTTAIILLLTPAHSVPLT
jgi:hypothetical protein